MQNFKACLKRIFTSSIDEMQLKVVVELGTGQRGAIVVLYKEARLIRGELRNVLNERMENRPGTYLTTTKPIMWMTARCIQRGKSYYVSNSTL